MRFTTVAYLIGWAVAILCFFLIKKAARWYLPVYTLQAITTMLLMTGIILDCL